MSTLPAAPKRAHLVGGGHDGLHLFQVIHIEGGNAIAVFGSMVEQLAHGDESHGGFPF